MIEFKKKKNPLYMKSFLGKRAFKSMLAKEENIFNLLYMIKCEKKSFFM